MVGVSTWLRYLSARIRHPVAIARRSCQKGTEQEVLGNIRKNLHDRLTFLHRYKGGEQMPKLGTQGGTLLVRKLPELNPTTYDVGDVVVLKDPANLDNILVRRVAAIEGYEMVPIHKKDRLFILVEDQCWIRADNYSLELEDAYDSRIFGPLYARYILGRAIYILRSAEDHGPVKNSRQSTMQDSAVLQVKLDIDEMTSFTQNSQASSI
ncbi:hypothetical protein ACS0TY_007328 [Phlomoides rotata]